MHWINDWNWGFRENIHKRLKNRHVINVFRPVSRYYDEHEHEEPQAIIDFMWSNRSKGFVTGLGVVGAMMVEELCWGDAGLYLASPGPGLGGAAGKSA